MEANKFELIGRVNHLEMKYLETGTIITRILLGKKGKNENEFDTFGINIFGKTAEEFAEKLKKGDYAHISGKVAVNKYTSKEGKTVERLELIGFDFSKVTYDTDAKRYVIANDNDTPLIEKSSDAKKEGTDTPW